MSKCLTQDKSCWETDKKVLVETLKELMDENLINKIGKAAVIIVVAIAMIRFLEIE